MTPKKVLVYTPTVGRGGVHRVVKTLTHTLAQVADPAAWQFAVLGQQYDEIGLPVTYPPEWEFTQIEQQIEPKLFEQMQKEFPHFRQKACLDENGRTNMLPPHPRQFQFLDLHLIEFVAHLQRAAADYDLVYCPSPWWTMPRPPHAPLNLSIPFVCTVADFAFDMIDMGPLAYNFRAVAQRIARTADYTVFASDFQRKHGERYYGFRTTRTIHHSADFVADNFSPTGDEGIRVREKYGLPEQYVLAFHPMYHKGINTILEAYALDGEPLPQLVLAGIGTQYLHEDLPAPDAVIENQRALLKDLTLKGVEVLALGRVPEEDIAGLYVSATCALAASTSEGDLSGTVFEAFMASCPLIYADLEVFTEQLQRDTYGLQFPVGNAGALQARILDVVHEPEQARRRALEAFGFANRRRATDVAGEYLDVFKHVLNERKAVQRD